MTPPLEGLLVVTLEQAVAAPYCSCKLADAGARVIKVERPEGDFARGYDRSVNGDSAYFVWLNRGKESIALDLKQEEERALLQRILEKADVFIQNLAPGAAGRLGFAPETLRARNPALITVDISGYGEDGDYAAMKAYDLLVQAETGLASITGRPEGPGRVGVSVCDIAAGMYAYMAVLEALLTRRETGEGKEIAVSLFDALADWMTVPYLQTVYGDSEPRRVGLNHPTIAPYGAYESAEGRQVVFSIQNEREWRRFCGQVLDAPALAEDARFHDNPARVANRAALDGEIAAVFSALSHGDVIQRLSEAGIAFGSVNSVRELAAHPVLRRLPLEAPHGRFETVAPPARIAGETPALRPVPTLDEDGPRIREEFRP